MKSTVIAQREVREVLKDFVVAELYTDATPWKAANAKPEGAVQTAALPPLRHARAGRMERSQLEGLSTSEPAFLKQGLNRTSMAPRSVEPALVEGRPDRAK
jgi:hypothetical protein